MTRSAALVIAVLAQATAFVAPPAATPALTPRQGLLEPYGSGVDPFKEIGSTLEVVEETQLLTKLAKTGLLSKAERAGVKLADLEPLLLFAEENGLVGLLGDLNDDLLPLLPLLVRLAPLGLPVLSLALGLGPLNFLLAIASFGGAFVVTGLPDDSVTDVALQTLIAVPLATLFPVLFGGLGLVSSKLA